MKRVLKWTAIVLVSIVGLAAVAIYGVSEMRLRHRFDIAAAPVTIPTDSATLANGRHVFETRGCTRCTAPSEGSGGAARRIPREDVLHRMPRDGPPCVTELETQNWV